MAMFNPGSYVWIPDEDEVVIPAEVVSAFSPGAAGSVKKIDSDKTIKLKANDTKDIVAMHPQCLEGVDDMVDFKELDENSILHNLRTRYYDDIIYTNIGKILTSVNPFKMLPIYSPQIMDEYMARGSHEMPPHVYGVADDAFNAMIDAKASQSCIVSGESGAGKTEATKVFLQYISEKSNRASAGNKTNLEGSSLQQKILETNPLLEAFGNAKTVRNDNSSRFGKWIEVQFENTTGAILGGSINSYLLEKSRLVFQADNERNYHIFYQICTVAEMDPAFEKYNIQDATQYYYLNQSTDPCTQVDTIDDQDEWNATTNAMEKIGITESERNSIIQLLAAILNLGNLSFEGVDKAKVTNKEVLETCSELWGCTAEQLERSLVKVYRGNPRDPDLVGDNNLERSCDARDAFAKYAYALLFDWLISKVNQSLGKVPHSDKISNIGVLDIFGFEFFENNSFEQLCINYCNERLQGHFNTHIFKLEQEQYEKEGVDVTKIDFVDNTNVIETIDKKGSGILQVIADELKMNTATDQTLLTKLRKTADATKAEVISYPGNKEVKKNAALDGVFRVKHYAGTVDYMIERFLEKNRDTVPVLVQRLGDGSSNSFIQSLFKGGTPKDSKSAKKALGIRFSTQLSDLMKELNATQPHYVRCVKPNAEKERESFTAEMVLDQLRYAGLLEVCRIRQMGYPVRREHKEFHQRYSYLVESKTADHVELAKALEAANILDSKNFQIGNTKVFLKNNQAEVLEEKRGVALARRVTDIQRVIRGGLVRKRFKSYKKIRDDISKAIKSRDKQLLKSAILNFGNLPYGGKHMKEYREAQDILNRIEDEERIQQLITDAIATRDVNQIEAALEAAAQKDLSNTAAAKEAVKLVETIKKETECKKELRVTLEKGDEAAMKNALSKAGSLGLLESIEAKEVQTRVNQIQKEREIRGNLQKAVDGKDIQSIKKFMNQMANIGKKEDPLVKEGEAICKEKAEEEAEIASKKADTLFALEKAMNERNLQALEDLEVTMIELGLEGKAIEDAKILREVLLKEKELCARLNAETTAANAKSHTKVGLIPEDIAKLEALIKEAEGVLPKDDDQLSAAREDFARLKHQLAAQKTMESTLANIKNMKKEMHKEKDNSKRAALSNQILQELKKGNQESQEYGVDTAAADEVRDQLNQFQLEVDDRNKEANEALRKANMEKLKEGTQDDADDAEATRFEYNSQFNELFSEKHRELVAEASNTARYDWSRYFRIRKDEDYVQNVPFEQKEAAAKTKLISQKKQINISLCQLDFNQNATALRINRAILQYCGDLASSFPATLAQYVLIRALEDPSITDEIYVQICKHANGNSKKESEDRAWLLMCMSTKIFPPTAEFAPYLVNFLINHKNSSGLIGNYARLCIVQLDATIELGPTWFKPNLEEIQSYRKRPPILATIHTLEGKLIDYPVTPEMRVAQVLDLVRRKERIDDDMDHPTWGIYVTAEEQEEKESPKDRLVRFYKKYNPSKLAHVDLFLDHWKSDPEELFEKLAFKYGPEPEKDQKEKPKTALALPITAAMNAVKFLGFGQTREQPPAPETPWPLPWWTHLGDVYFRMTKQNKLPHFVFKRRLITRNDPVDKWLYLQALDDIRMGYIPTRDPQKISHLAALAVQHKLGDKVPASTSEIKDGGLQKFIPGTALKQKSVQEYAELVLNLIKKGSIPTSPEKIWEDYVGIAKTNPIYGMNYFYARHAASDKNYVISVDVDGIHVLDTERTKVNRSFGFQTIRKFGATAEYFWMNIDEPNADQKKSKFQFLNSNSGINVLLYTLQSWEMYDCVYDATHYY